MVSEKSGILYELMLRKGYPEGFARIIAAEMNTDFTAERMISYIGRSGKRPLEEVADEVMFLYRDDYYYRDSERKGMAELDVKKSRGGMLGVVDLVYIPEYQMFKNREKSRRVHNNVHCD